MTICGWLRRGVMSCAAVLCAMAAGADSEVANPSEFVSLFSQKFYAEREEDGVAAYLSTEWCTFFLPTLKGSRKCQVDGSAILLDQGMEKYEVEEKGDRFIFFRDYDTSSPAVAHKIKGTDLFSPSNGLISRP